ncbi:hypothetical protein [Bacillus sp. 03113]|uniref:hypothetical protein n=1 Tax=Bacillus sp. 03113 TaxID=2578211 RepID=UPI0015E8894F|nr:hypothetical protein [Bacillus sp. 03113]
MKMLNLLLSQQELIGAFCFVILVLFLIFKDYKAVYNVHIRILLAYLIMLQLLQMILVH